MWYSYTGWNEENNKVTHVVCHIIINRSCRSGCHLCTIYPQKSSFQFFSLFSINLMLQTCSTRSRHHHNHQIKDYLPPAKPSTPTPFHSLSSCSPPLPLTPPPQTPPSESHSAHTCPETPRPSATTPTAHPTPQSGPDP